MEKLDIIIPVYNEDENIIRLLKQLDEKIVCNFKILICYDSDSDKTLKHLQKKNLINRKLLFIKNPKQGPNSAIIEGIKVSDAEIVLVYMADDFENIQLINEMVKIIEQGNDLIIPSRFIPGGKMLGAERVKENITRIGSNLIYYLANIPFKDCTNAFKMFTKSLKEKIKLNSTTGFTFALELTTKSYILKSKIVEIPSTWVEIKNRKSNFKVFKWLPYYIYWLLYSILLNYLMKIKSIINKK